MDYRSGPVQDFYHPPSPGGQEGEQRPPHEETVPPPAQDLEAEKPPPYPPRPQPHEPEYPEEKPPQYPPRPEEQTEPQPAEYYEAEKPPPYPPRPEHQPTAYQPPPPPRRARQAFGDDDPSNPIHYTRDPHKLIAYLIPFPKPVLKDTPPDRIPDRFIVYTPPPPPLSKPADGEKEDRMHKVQRKWQQEVREAKTSTAKTTSWKGIKSRATRGIDWAVNQTTSSNLDFINRLGDDHGSSKQKGPAPTPGPATATAHDDDGIPAETTTTTAPPPSPKKTLGLTEMIIVYPPGSSAAGSTAADVDPSAAMRAEFVSSMLRTKTKAQRDAVLATGLLPVSFAVDVLATVVWPFGGLVEMDVVWMYSSVRGAKIARSTARRLDASSPTSASESESAAKGGGGGGGGDGGMGEEHGGTKGDGDGNDDNAEEEKEGKLALTFTPSRRIDVLRRYLAARCRERDAKLFANSGGGPSPTETEVLEAIGWAPSQTSGERRNWEDEQWEVAEVKEDFRYVMAKGAREWDKWCKAFVKDPEKAVKK
ncbi:uncharacterized protein BKCO1_6700031 [Diplodia corticola]|uniref:Secreted protein n=1 Tax=Diplodia corticola TaxID=236234 RepID=A0A1J9QNM2_9PEZI|nr:uncharacterized protein BKCO1_6700031 [Diplodia corticola]OJD30049.1 secreted protein [Diplodia corticola]